MSVQELAARIGQYGRDVYSFCMHLAHDRTEADELYQDTWLRVVKNLPEIDPEGNLKSYCLSVALGLWKNRKRKYAWRSRIVSITSYDRENEEESLLDCGVSPEEEVISRQERQAVWDAVSKLPEKMRLIVLFYYMERLSVSQISEVMDVPQGTVKSRLYQARKKLAEELGDLL